MRSRARCLVDKSVAAMVAAIESYNKPNTSYREETFVILAANAWELLLKARILQLDNNRIAALLVYERRQRADGTLSSRLSRKKNRCGNVVSIGLFQAYDRLVNNYADTVDSAVRTNLASLVEVRDNAVHFFNKSSAINKAIQEVGAACLRNYVQLTRSWFAVDFSKYNFYLIPLAFVQDVDDYSGLNLNAEERHVLRFLDSARVTSNESSDFSPALTIDFRLRKGRESDAPSFRLSNEPDAVPMTLGEEDIRDRYPWDYAILTKKLQTRYRDFKANQEYHDRRKAFDDDHRYSMERLLDPGKPNGLKKRFYSPNILREFDQYYVRAKPLST